MSVERSRLRRVVELLNDAMASPGTGTDQFTLTRAAKLVMLRNQAALADDVAGFERAVRNELRSVPRWQSAANGTRSALEDALRYAAAARTEK